MCSAAACAPRLLGHGRAGQVHGSPLRSFLPVAPYRRCDVSLSFGRTGLLLGGTEG